MKNLELQFPTREQIAALQPFAGLGMKSIRVVESLADADAAMEDLFNYKEVGFDTESRPTFRKHEESQGPHVLQFATLQRAYVFQFHVKASRECLVELLKSPNLAKIGFGLNDDISRISKKFAIEPMAIVDLNHAFNRLGYKNSVGTKTAVAYLFNKKLLKSKSATTSNWSMHKLTEKQIVYAANDAYAAIRVFLEMKKRGLLGE